MIATHKPCCRHRSIALCVMFLCAFAVCMEKAAAQECLGRIVSFEEAVADYNPFSPIAYRNPFSVTIENSGDTACRYRLGAKTNGAGKDFSFRIETAHGELLMASNAAGTGSELASRRLEPGETQRLGLIYILPEGQYLSPGQFRSGIELILTDADGSGDGKDVLHTVSLPLLCSVDDYLGVNIAGAGLTKTVDFGELIEGDSRRVVIKARTNRNFLLEIESRHGRALVMEPPYQNWRIEYGIDLNGKTLRLPYRAGPYERGGIRGQSFSLDFRVGDVESKRAGLYTDEIIVTIKPAL